MPQNKVGGDFFIFWHLKNDVLQCSVGFQIKNWGGLSFEVSGMGSKKSQGEWSLILRQQPFPVCIFGTAKNAAPKLP